MNFEISSIPIHSTMMRDMHHTQQEDGLIEKRHQIKHNKLAYMANKCSSKNEK